MNLTSKLIKITLLVLLASSLFAQNSVEIVDNYLQQQVLGDRLESRDIVNYSITHSHTSKRSGISHYYLQQSHRNIPIFDAVMGIHFAQDNGVITANNQFISAAHSKINTTAPTITAQAAIEAAAQHLGYQASINAAPLEILENIGGDKQEARYSDGGISRIEIPVQLTYQPFEGALRLCWELSIDDLNSADWWSLRVDAVTGQVLHQYNFTLYCDFGHDECQEEGHHNHAHAHNHAQNSVSETNKSGMVAPDSYRVYEQPLESPLFGGRTLVTDPADPTASPFGWHDTDGVAGAEYTITRGNNVWAQDDLDGNNGTGYSPDGSASLDFDYSLDLTQNPSTGSNLDAGITNLFYWNNLVHDVWYSYGFDEASGNYQDNNYGNGGAGGDAVFADAQDGGGTNNANFSSQTDGNNGRMQMFLWTGASGGTLTVNSPAGIAGGFSSESAQFGAGTYNVTGDLVFVNDGTGSPSLGCDPATNGAAISGNIAMVDRGTCEFGTKCLNAENAGAIAVIVCNNTGGAPIAMSPGADGASVTIPAVMISQADCATIRAEIPTVNATLASGSSANRDGDLDNGIVAHEYGHGISTRLTGGAGNSSCLGNSEQMGEGWSDWFGLMMTIDPTDTRDDLRPIGTFALGQGIGGSGIRTYPYSCDLNANPHTYNDIANEAVPHGVGSVWCAMLWEMTWDLIDLYGYDPDIHNGTGGNNIAMALVIEGLKLQPCSPGFIDGRDAIILADQNLYNGDNKCLINQAFARRGLGATASQGSTGSTSDGSEDFNPADCGPPTCEDGLQNGDELGVDCGGPDCPDCPDEDCTIYDFTGQVVSYDVGNNDNGTAEVQDAGATVFITGNGWKAVPLNYTVTSNTVLEFDFKSTVEGEIHEISFDNDLVVEPTHRLVIYGNQGYNGTFVTPNYSGSGDFEHFTIEIGANFTGTFQYLVVTCDDDANSTGDSFFRNVQIYEDYDNNLTCDNPGPSCTVSESYTGTVLPGTYTVSNTISSTGVVQNGSTVVFDANCIELNAEFEVEAGADFLAQINPCVALTGNTNALESGEEFIFTQNVVTKETFITYTNVIAGEVSLIAKALDSDTEQFILNKENLTKGEQTLHFDSSVLKKGTYLLILQTEGRELTKKVVFN